MESPYDGYKYVINGEEIGAGEMVLIGLCNWWFFQALGINRDILSSMITSETQVEKKGSMRPFSVSVSLGSLGLIATKKKA